MERAATKRTADGLPVHGLRAPLADLATLTLNEVALPASPDHAVRVLARPTPLQERAFALPKVDPASGVAMQEPGWKPRLPRKALS